ncbi:ArsR/SmtB family transcription factor [Agrococcus beijingensis]|uniref:ArsR/SmtB family transcription factor n=1 Tax=Agrococcus beijingensis TaxID=3068634 RepID=UPI002741E014|nr:metalloregulator ArsR/SmtB family transcription factor [Agrococcus sp. REN33]
MRETVWCTPGEPALERAEAEAIAARLKAVAEPSRLRMLSMLAATDGEICVCDLADAIDVSQPTASHHAKVLVAAGLIEREQRGKWAHYRVVDGALDELGALLRSPGRA